MSRKTAALLVLILIAVAARPLACAWWCMPGEAVHAGCHDRSSTNGAQLASGSGCDVDVVDAAVTLTKTPSLERIAFVPVSVGAGVDRHSGYESRISVSPPGRFLPAQADRLTVLRI